MNVRIPLFTNLIKYFTIFWGYVGPKLLVLLAVTTVSTLTESLGLALFIPILIKTNLAAEAPDKLSAFFNTLFTYIGAAPSIYSLFVIIILVFILKGFIHFALCTYQAYLSARTTSEIRRKTINAFANISYPYYIQSDTGFFSNLVTLETARAVASFNSFCAALISLMTIAVFLVVSLLINWHFTLTTVVLGGLTLYCLRFLSTITKRYSFQRSNEYASLHSLLIQSLQAFKYMKATDAFNTLKKKLSKNIDTLAGIEFRTMFLGGIIRALTEPLIILCIILLMLYQISVVQGSLAPIVVSIMFFYRIFQRIMAFQKEWQNFSSFAGSIETVNNATAEILKHQESGGTTSFKSFEKEIRFENVGFQFDDKKVLEGINLTIKKNSTVAIVGESGVGKTTLVDIITGILTPHQGRVLLDGHPLLEIDYIDWRQRIGYVIQEPVLFNDTVENNISLWSCESHAKQCTAKVKDAACKAHCGHFIDGLKDRFTTHIGDRGIKLSGGQGQRIAIARELFKKPELLILDEATSALDAESEIAIQESITELQGRLTVIIITHRISTLRAADEIHVMSEGRIVEQGTFDTLTAQPDSRFNKMCALQNITQ